MIIFNVISLVEVLAGAAIGGIVAGILYLLGLDVTFWFVVVTAGVAAPIDLLVRFASVAGGDDEEGGEASEGGSILDLVTPGGGGHLFFLPVWVVGIGFVIAAFVWG